MTKYLLTFPSPCGVWVVSGMRRVKLKKYQVSVPLRGVGCFPFAAASSISFLVSVPLRGVGCFHSDCAEGVRRWFPSPCGVWVVSGTLPNVRPRTTVSVPLRGVGCFWSGWLSGRRFGVSVPLRGVGCFYNEANECDRVMFPSPCGVWVVSQ